MNDTRKKLSNRRPGDTLTFVVGSLKYHATISWFEDGSLSEVFLTAGKPGTEVHILTRDLGLMVSLLLQFGCPEEHIRGAVTRSPDGSADGPLGILLDLVKDQRDEVPKL